MIVLQIFRFVVVVGCVAAAGCELAQPFQGPGYSLSSGLTSTAPGPFVVATTLLEVKDDAEARAAFDGFMAPMTEALPTAPGLVGSSLATGPDGYRTLSVWESEDAMLGWVVSSVHADAMGGMVQHVDGGATASWTMTREELLAGPPSWDDAKARLDGEGASAY